MSNEQKATEQVKPLGNIDDVLDQAARDAATMIADTAKEAGIELARDATEIANYLIQRGKNLVKATGEPAYLEAVYAERDNVILFAANRAVNRADAFDSRIAGIADTALNILARLAAGLLPTPTTIGRASV